MAELEKEVGHALAEHFSDVADDLAASLLVHLVNEGVVLARYSDALAQCPSCELYFPPATARQIYCREACRQKAFRERTVVTQGVQRENNIQRGPMIVAPADHEPGTITVGDVLRSAAKAARKRRDEERL